MDKNKVMKKLECVGPQVKLHVFKLVCCLSKFTEGRPVSSATDALSLDTNKNVWK